MIRRRVQNPFVISHFSFSICHPRSTGLLAGAVYFQRKMINGKWKISCLSIDQSLIPHMTRGCAHDLPDQSHPRQQTYHVSGKIDFIPPPAMDRASRPRVMVIVPAFSERRQTQPPYVATLVPGVVGSLSPNVADTIDAPGKVPQRQGSRHSSPKHSAPTGNGITKNSCQKPR